MNNLFTNKKIAVLGLSTEGLDVIKFLLKIRPKVNITGLDQKTAQQFSPEIINYLQKKPVKLILGENYLNTLSAFDLIIRSPGFPLRNKELKKAHDKGVEITSLTKLFFENCSGKIIGVTGTKGKGTCSSLIAKMLKRKYSKVFLGGNIGQPLLSKISQINKNSWIVLELSSFQLEDLKRSPKIAVVLNITSDHLASGSFDSPNYHLNINEYLEAKRNILKYQDISDYAVVNVDYSISKDLTNITKAKIWPFSRKRKIKIGAYYEKNKLYLSDQKKIYFLVDKKDLILRGDHNLENILAASLAAYLAGVSLKEIVSSILSFKGLDHRLQFIRSINGVNYYNDSFSTTPETAIAAIRSFSEPKIMILGGSDKGAEFIELAKEIKNTNIKLIILIGQMADKIEKSLFKIKAGIKIIKGLINMDQIVQTAYLNSQKGDVVLLSPACASFDLFKNYKDRGEQFIKAVKKIEK